MNTYTKNISWTKIYCPFISKNLYVSTTPVTVSQFRLFIRNKGYYSHIYWSKKGFEWLSANNIEYPKYWNDPEYSQDTQPVTGISYWEAEAFAKFSGARLLTETEWTMLCSNFNTSKYPWGDQSADKNYANLSFFGAFSENEITQVYKYKNGSTQDGLMDFIGNVSEWCSHDLANDSTETAILKGGCFWHSPIHVDCSSKDTVLCNTRDNQTGIRLILNPSTTFTKYFSKKYQPLPSSFSNKELERPTKPFRHEGIPSTKTLSKWKLKVFGEVKNKLQFNYKEIRNLPSTTITGLFVCVCRWADKNIAKGISIKKLIELAEPSCPFSQLYLVFISMKGSNGNRYISSIPLEDAIKNNGILCYELDNSELSKELGFPLRYIDFNLYGYKQVKCIEMIQISKKQITGYWEKEMQYDVTGKIQSGTVTVIGKNSYRKEIL